MASRQKLPHTLSCSAAPFVLRDHVMVMLSQREGADASLVTEALLACCRVAVVLPAGMTRHEQAAVKWADALMCWLQAWVRWSCMTQCAVVLTAGISKCINPHLSRGQLIACCDRPQMLDCDRKSSCQRADCRHQQAGAQ